jgi:hypothetical protein
MLNYALYSIRMSGAFQIFVVRRLFKNAVLNRAEKWDVVQMLWAGDNLVGSGRDSF